MEVERSPCTCKTKEECDQKADDRGANQCDTQLALHGKVVLTATFDPRCPARIE
jgi:hypothetical protein